MKEIIYSKNGTKCYKLYVKLEGKGSNFRYLFGYKKNLEKYVQDYIENLKMLRKVGYNSLRAIIDPVDKAKRKYKYRWFHPVQHKMRIADTTSPTIKYSKEYAKNAGWLDPHNKRNSGDTIINPKLTISAQRVEFSDLKPTENNVNYDNFTYIKVPASVMDMIESTDVETAMLGVNIFEKEIISRYKSGLK